MINVNKKQIFRDQMPQKRSIFDPSGRPWGRNIRETEKIQSNGEGLASRDHQLLIVHLVTLISFPHHLSTTTVSKVPLSVITFAHLDLKHHRDHNQSLRTCTSTDSADPSQVRWYVEHSSGYSTSLACQNH